MENINAPAIGTHNAPVSATSLILQGDYFAKVMDFADLMASGKVSVPQHFRGNKSDCAALIMQSMQWNMNPYIVASKTYMSPNGTLAYEAQLVNGVINSIGPLEGRPRYEHIGDWDKIVGRVKEMKKENDGKTTKYYVSDWSANDENGLGVICHYKIKGEPEYRSLKVMLNQCWPRFSTQWATDPRQQICYSAIKKVARLDFPDVILGVYTIDEFEPVDYVEREVNPEKPSAPEEPQQKPIMPDDKFDKNFPAYERGIQSGKNTADKVITTLQKQYTITEEQERRIREVAPPIEGELVGEPK